MRKSIFILLILVVICGLFVADGGVSAETTLSSDGLNPTAFTLAAGSNPISGVAIGHPDVRYFSVTVPADHYISAIKLTQHQNGDSTSWFAAMSGSQFTENSTSASLINVSNLLGESHVGTGVNALPYDVMPDMDFSMPLSTGTYSFRMQNWQTGITFAFDIEVSPGQPSSVAVQSTGSQIASATASGLIALSAIILVLFTILSFSASQKTEH